jgi:hypothetical protein
MNVRSTLHKGLVHQLVGPAHTCPPNERWRGWNVHKPDVIGSGLDVTTT